MRLILLIMLLCSSVYAERYSIAGYTRGAKEGYAKLSGGTDGGNCGMMVICDIGIVRETPIFEQYVFAKLLSSKGNRYWALIEFPTEHNRKFLKYLKRRFNEGAKYCFAWGQFIGTYKSENGLMAIYAPLQYKPENQRVEYR